MLYKKNKIYDFHYDYAKCMMMKLSMAHPNPKDVSKSHVIMTFEQALDYIKKIDAMTPFVTKIYYLVGWQYNGHDDKYPDFFEVNNSLKRQYDKSPEESLLWLHNEAKKYNSVVSLHINFNDAYDDAPSFGLFKANGALIRKKNGTPHAIEKYNGKPCYKTCFKGYWESGIFKKQIDRLLKLLPFLKECGTVHVDNFQCYKNYAPYVSIAEMQNHRRKMIDYVQNKGIEITSEFTYREDEKLRNRNFLGLPREHHSKTPMDTVGLIPASWWCTRMTRRDLTEISPTLYSGGMYRDGRYAKYLYGNMHGEEIICPETVNWEQKFIHDFATVQVPYHFLSTHEREEISGWWLTEKCNFSDGITSAFKNQTITKSENILKEKDTLFMPYVHKENCYFAYSKNGDTREWNISEKPFKNAEIYQLTPQGMQLKSKQEIKNEHIYLKIEPHEALLIIGV